MMIQFRLKELIAQHERQTGGRWSYRRIRDETGISPNTLSRMARQKMQMVDVGTLEKLCDLFDCQPGDLIIHQQVGQR